MAIVRKPLRYLTPPNSTGLTADSLTSAWFITIQYILAQLIPRTLRMASIADHYAMRRPNLVPRKSQPGDRLSSNGYPRARASLIANHAGKGHSTATLRLSVAKAAAMRSSTSNFDECPGKHPRISSMSAHETPADVKVPAETAPAPSATQGKILEPVHSGENPNLVDLTAETNRKIDTTSANARARRKSRSSLGRQSLSRNTILGSHPPRKHVSRWFIAKCADPIMSATSQTKGFGKQVWILEVLREAG